MVSRTSGAGSPSWSCAASQYSSVSDEPSCHVRRTTSARSAGYEWAMRPVYHTAVPATDGRPRRQRDADLRADGVTSSWPARRPLWTTGSSTAGSGAMPRSRPHVAAEHHPSRIGPGYERIRHVPLIAIRQAHYVSHTIEDHTSFLALIEKRFRGDAHLTARDAHADTLEDMFDFDASPSADAVVAIGGRRGSVAGAVGHKEPEAEVFREVCIALAHLPRLLGLSGGDGARAAARMSPS